MHGKGCRKDMTASFKGWKPGWEDKTKRKVPDTPNGLGWQDTRDLGGYRSAGAFRKGFPEEVEPGLLWQERRTLEESVEAEICKELLCIQGKGWAGVLGPQWEVLEKTLNWEEWLRPDCATRPRRRSPPIWPYRPPPTILTPNEALIGVTDKGTARRPQAG